MNQIHGILSSAPLGLSSHPPVCSPPVPIPQFPIPHFPSTSFPSLTSHPPVPHPSVSIPQFPIPQFPIPQFQSPSRSSYGCASISTAVARFRPSAPPARNAASGNALSATSAPRRSARPPAALKQRAVCILARMLQLCTPWTFSRILQICMFHQICTHSRNLHISAQTAYFT